MRIVCDTNVFVSGILFGGNCRDILLLASEGKVEGFTSGAILLELEGVLLQRRFELATAQVNGYIETVRETFRTVTPTEAVNAVPNDPDDNAVLEAALAAHADVIVSGDLDLLRLGVFRSIRIPAPANFLQEFVDRLGHAG